MEPRSVIVKRCPICAKPMDIHYRPFCSKRCADVDLHRWLSGSYAVPVVEDDDEDGNGQGNSGGSRDGQD